MNRFVLCRLSVIGVAFSAGTALAQDNRFIFPAWARNVDKYGGSSRPHDLAVADYDSDGLLDVATLCPSTNPPILCVLLGQPDGSLGEPQKSSLAVLGGRISTGAILAAGDFVPGANGLPDGLVDLVVVGELYDYWNPTRTMAILRNLGPEEDYCFEVNEIYTPPGVVETGGPFTVAVGDFNCDGLLDVAHGGPQYCTTDYIWYARESGYFADPVSIPGGCPLASADLDHDGCDDLVVALYNNLKVFYGDPSGLFARRWEYPHLGPHPIGAVVQDFDGDGRLDIATTGQGTPVSVYYADDQGAFDAPVSFNSGTGQYRALAPGDVDGDGRPDLILSNVSSGPISGEYGSILYSRGSGGFTAPVPFAAGYYPRSLAVADIDRDGRSEVIVGDAYSEISVTRSRPRGLIATGQDYTLVGRDPWALAQGDFDGDGLPDLAVLNRADDDITILRDTPGGILERAAGPDLHVGPTPQDLVSGYFDDDDILDLLTTNSGTGSITIWHGDDEDVGSFLWREYLYPTLPGSSSSLTTFYLDDQDDRMDIAFIAGAKVVVLRGVAGGSLDDDHPEVYTCGTGPLDIIAADLNFDGLIDLATANSSRRIAVLYGQVDGTFGDCEEHDLAATLPGNWTAQSIALGDVNNDGRMDLIASWYKSSTLGTITILFGEKGGTLSDPAKLDDIVGDSAGELAIDDFDRDTLPDIAVSGVYAQHIYFGEEDGGLSYQRYARRYGAAYRNPMAVADFDIDGRPDIANASNGTPTHIGLMLNQSNAKLRGELELVSVSAPSTGVGGAPITVQWRARNPTHHEWLTGKWTDAVYLSTDQQWDINDRRLGLADFIGTLAPMGVADSPILPYYDQSLEVPLPGMADGTYYILVRADAKDSINEPSGEVGNLMAVPITISLPTLSVCEADPPCPGVDGTFLPNRRAFYYKLEARADEDLLVTLDAASDEGINELYIRYGAIPTRSVFDAKYQNGVASDQTARIPGTVAGTYYVLDEG